MGQRIIVHPTVYLSVGIAMNLCQNRDYFDLQAEHDRSVLQLVVVTKVAISYRKDRDVVETMERLQQTSPRCRRMLMEWS